MCLPVSPCLRAHLATSGTGSCAPVPVMRSFENAESNAISSSYQVKTNETYRQQLRAKIHRRNAACGEGAGDIGITLSWSHAAVEAAVKALLNKNSNTVREIPQGPRSKCSYAPCRFQRNGNQYALPEVSSFSKCFHPPASYFIPNSTRTVANSSHIT